MALELYWTRKAGFRFEKIIEYIEAEFGEKVAKVTAQNIHHTLDILSIFPELGSIENIEFNIRGLVISKQITLFYQIRTDRIVLLNFYDNRQQPERIRY